MQHKPNFKRRTIKLMTSQEETDKSNKNMSIKSKK